MNGDSLNSMGAEAELALAAEISHLKVRAELGDLDNDESERLARAVRALCSLSKERREAASLRRKAGAGLATEDALRELLSDAGCRALVLRLLSERMAQGLEM